MDVSAVLEESGALERAYDSVVRDPLDGRPDDVLATLQPEEIERVLVHRGPAVMRDGQIVVQGRTLQRETGSKSGYGMVKIIFAHGEGGNKHPNLPPVTREDVIALPRLIRDFESFIDGEHRVWRIPREDGNALHIVTRHGEDGPGERLVSMYVGPLQPKQTFSAKKPPVASSALASYRSKDTGRGITLSHPAGKQRASHMTDSSLPDAAAPVNRPAPDFSTAAEPPAPARLTPDEARRTETEALAHQDEALRQGMNDLEAQGRADTGELTSARTDADPLVRETADTIARYAADARRRFNLAGGDMGLIEGWTPQRHDVHKLVQAGQDAWQREVLPLLDMERTFGRDASDPERVQELLSEVYETLISGRNGFLPGGRPGRDMAAPLEQSRVLHFKSGADAIAYNDRFGAGNLFDAVLQHLDRMARAIALMERLGPNPEQTVRRLIDDERARDQFITTALDNAPFVNMWHTRTALNYALLYHVKEWMSPGSLRRMERRMRKQQRREFFLPPSSVIARGGFQFR